MLFRGLKTNITVQLAILLLLGMIFLDIVMISAAQKDLINLELSKTDIFVASIKLGLKDAQAYNRESIQPDVQEYLTDVLKQAKYSCLMIQGKAGGSPYVTGAKCSPSKELEEITRESLTKRKKITRMIGTAWGSLWKGRQMLVAVPVLNEGKVIGGIGIVKELDEIYNVLGRTQNLLFIYIIVNTIILTLIGLYTLSRITIRPLKRLVTRAEEYSEDGGMFFLAEKGENEFAKLSKSLNRLLKRISMDRDKLQRTVMSLEKANYELTEAQKDIIKAEKLASVGRLSSGIAHEIGNPIGIIMGYLDLLKHDDITREERNEFLERAGNEVEKINGIIRQLLSYARPSEEGLKKVSVHDIIKEIAAVVKVQPLMSEVHLKLRLSARKDGVYANADQLRQVFLNLIINAADAIHALDNERKGEVIISSEIIRPPEAGFIQKKSMLKITYTDNGIGIPEENLTNIFDPFYTTKEPGKGTGLGLSVSFMIIEGINGKIEATSREGRGTTISIYLPLSEGSSDQ